MEQQNFNPSNVFASMKGNKGVLDASAGPQSEGESHQLSSLVRTRPLTDLEPSSFSSSFQTSTTLFDLKLLASQECSLSLLDSCNLSRAASCSLSRLVSRDFEPSRVSLLLSFEADHLLLSSSSFPGFPMQMGGFQQPQQQFPQPTGFVQQPGFNPYQQQQQQQQGNYRGF